jgi:GNAT superfamily N-acetyltransferase
MNQNDKRRVHCNCWYCVLSPFAPISTMVVSVNRPNFQKGCLLASLLIYVPRFYPSSLVRSFVLNSPLPTLQYPALPAFLLRQQPPHLSEKLPLATKIHILTDCDESTIQEVSEFLIDSYWLTTPRLWTDPTANTSCDVKANASVLQHEAAIYLNSQYGERMGKRLLKTCIVAAEADSVLVGALCMHELIWDDGNILSDEESEAMLRNAVAALSPKDRRPWKDASAIDISSELLSSSTKAVCVFSNLAVSSFYRRQGIAMDLCQAAEEVAKEWGYKFLHLKVEAGNNAAATLYREKLGYSLERHLVLDTAIRLDLAAASFVDTKVETLVMSKMI